MSVFLSISERVALTKRHRSEKDGRTRDRIKAVLLYDKGWTFQKIAEALLLNQETVSAHIREYQEDKKLSIETGGSESKLNAEQTSELVSHIEQSTYLKAIDICCYVQEQYGVSYTVAGMTNWLKSNDFSYKCPKKTPHKADPIKQKEFMEKYGKLMHDTPANEPILFGDAVHPTMATKVTCGWIRKGQDKLISSTGSRTRMNLFGAINLETMQVNIESYVAINQASMEDYFASLRRSYPIKNNPKIHLILDQSSYNKGKETEKAASKHGIILHYLPPYSPNLNPIERLWKVMNEYVRNNKFFKTASEFREKILHFFNNTWSKIAESMVDRINDNFEQINSAFSG